MVSCDWVREKVSIKIYKQKFLEKNIGCWDGLGKMIVLVRNYYWMRNEWSLKQQQKENPCRTLSAMYHFTPATLVYKDSWNAKSCQRFLNFSKHFKVTLNYNSTNENAQFWNKSLSLLFHSFFKFFLNNTFYNRKCSIKKLFKLNGKNNKEKILASVHTYTHTNLK